MTPREIRSNCGNPRLQRLKARVQSGTILQLDAAVLVDFGGGAQDYPALFAVHAGKLFGEEAQLARGFFVEAPDCGEFLFGEAQFLDGSFVVGEKLVQRDSQGARQFFERLDGRDRAAIFQARKVTAKQSSAVLDIALREVLSFAEPLQPFADHHGQSQQYLAVPTQLLLEQNSSENASPGRGSLRPVPRCHISAA